MLRRHCADAGYIWNLAVEQQSWWRSGRSPAPGYHAQASQLTEARAEHGWLAHGSQMVQQQALRDFAQAMAYYFGGTRRRPTWRKEGRNEGFRVVAVVRAHSPAGPQTGEVWVPKAGWVRFRWSRAVPAAKSYRVTRDRSGRWHIAFAAVPAPIPGPGTGEVVGIDRGVAVSAALSTGEMLHCPGMRPQSGPGSGGCNGSWPAPRRARPARASQERDRVASRPVRGDRRKDWAEKSSTGLARRFDLIRIEDLNIRGMTRSARGTVRTRPQRPPEGRPSTGQSWPAAGGCSRGG